MSKRARKPDGLRAKLDRNDGANLLRAGSLGRHGSKSRDVDRVASRPSAGIRRLST